ncbi:helix-turn-helix transcriptional regulator [Novosphingobium profundi]|uniref:helix-turn-helix transcriptional regulator n=1 Tax=Novosphingobium profundi TaxID=1774954 RepID=UPI001CFEA01E|nr:YafY family protein [Novosphingobium profundi]
MRRADRLFEIIQVLRQASRPLSGDAIAAALETSRRTIYRDIATLIAQRVPIRGEPGVGYVLEKGFDLPPLMLTSNEVEAVTLGAQWVIAHADTDLARGAMAVLAKLAAIVPDDLRPLFDDPAVGTPPPREQLTDATVDVARLREWSRRGQKIRIDYRDENGAVSERIAWPFMVGYVVTIRSVMAWCEMRQDFRIFRTDRIMAIDFLDEKYPEHAVVLRRRWLTAMADAQRASEEN